MDFRKVKVSVVHATPVLFKIDKNVYLVISWIRRAVNEG
jgi:hypothetical protein